ncbi:hypothetical protein K440DRAFT_623950 [Wilcoxina mikolae CBS 423.85]|nr:hypothetical protein K440DRAFT_623950 [Wilcoxina mikolae CBS 423.85]
MARIICIAESWSFNTGLAMLMRMAHAFVLGILSIVKNARREKGSQDREREDQQVRDSGREPEKRKRGRPVTTGKYVG